MRPDRYFIDCISNKYHNYHVNLCYYCVLYNRS